ncbi:MAG: hypothetical protein LBI14_04800 [Treponema sp.]|jgi:hypothetical protein|nr:hypothetical protein [Treponema sp.]
MLFIGLNAVFGDSSLENLLDSAQIAALRSGNRPTEIQFRDFIPRLIPNHAELRNMVEATKRRLNINVMVETLFLFQKPAGADRNGWTQNEVSALYNEIIAISSLQGIQYYSVSRGAMRTFYETSSVVDGPSTKRPLPDPNYWYPPAELSLYAHQKDLTFGDNIYQYTYRYSPGALIITQENITSLTYGIITAVGRNNLNSMIALLDAGDSIVIYAVSMARTASFPGIRDRIGDSFSNRAEAVLQWINAGAERAFRITH